MKLNPAVRVSIALWVLIIGGIIAFALWGCSAPMDIRPPIARIN